MSSAPTAASSLRPDSYRSRALPTTSTASGLLRESDLSFDSNHRRTSSGLLREPNSILNFNGYRQTMSGLRPDPHGSRASPTTPIARRTPPGSIRGPNSNRCRASTGRSALPGHNHGHDPAPLPTANSMQLHHSLTGRSNGRNTTPLSAVDPAPMRLHYCLTGHDKRPRSCSTSCSRYRMIH